MTRNLSSLTIAALDQLEHMVNLQELLQIGLEELGNPGEKTQQRLDLLIAAYLSQVEYHFNEQRVCLDRIYTVLANLTPQICLETEREDQG